MIELKCPVCGKTLFSEVGEYQYLESGLPNVRLGGVQIARCECGEEIVSIPMVLELQKLIAECLLKKSSQLSGREIRFLRKNMALKAKDFARLLGVEYVTVSRWERGENRPSESNDRLIRLTYASFQGLGNLAQELARDILRDIRPIQEESPIYLPLDRLQDASCLKST